MVVPGLSDLDFEINPMWRHLYHSVASIVGIFRHDHFFYQIESGAINMCKL